MPQNNKKRANIIKEYTNLYKNSADASTIFNSVIASLENKGVDLGEIGGRQVVYLNPEYLTRPPKSPNDNIVKLSYSADFMKDKSVRVRDAIATLLQNQNLKSLLEPEKLNELNEVQTMLIQSEKSANRIEEGIQKTMNSEEASNELVDYYQSIVDIEFASRSLHTVANEINIEEKNIPEDFQHIAARQNIFSKLINKIIKIGDRIKNKIERIIKRFEGFAKEVGSFISKSLDKLKDVLLREEMKSLTPLFRYPMVLQNLHQD